MSTMVAGPVAATLRPARTMNLEGGTYGPH